MTFTIKKGEGLWCIFKRQQTALLTDDRQQKSAAFGRTLLNQKTPRQDGEEIFGDYSKKIATKRYAFGGNEPNQLLFLFFPLR